MKYKVVETSMFKKELKIIKKRRKSIQQLKNVINTLLKGEKLEAKYRDHVLNNDKRFQDCRECHIEPNLLYLLLIYRIVKEELILLLVEIGTHSDLFK